MPEDNRQSATPTDPKQMDKSAGATWFSRGVRVLVILVVITAAAGVSIYWLTNRPTAKRLPPLAKATLVDVIKVTRKTHKVVVDAMGTVVHAREIQLSPQVGGKIIDVSKEFVPGGRFVTGEKILKIEPKDYELAVHQQKSALAKVQCDLTLEMGQQSVSKREYELLGKKVEDDDEELILRKPQLAMAKAAVMAAQANLEQAILDLKRTEVTAPFNSMVKSRNVTLGSQVTAGTALASLVGTDEYWVQISVPLDELRWINVPKIRGNGGSTVRVYCESAWGPSVFRTATVERLMTNLEPQGRMAQLLLVVKDPLGLSSDSPQPAKMILDSYIRVEIEGSNLQNVIEIPRTVMHDGNRVWVMRPDNTLDIRTVDTVWSSDDNIYITKGLNEGDLLITSGIAASVQGMSLRTNGSSLVPPATDNDKAVHPDKTPETAK